MFYIGLQGGLGNQMFQYAFGRVASLESNVPLALDLDNFGKEGPKYTARHFLLNHFNIQAHIATPEETARFHTKKYWWLRKLKNRLDKFRNKSEHIYDPSQLKVKNGQYLQGFWQSEKYFKKYSDIIRKELSLKDPFGMEAKSVFDQIQSMKASGTQTILVHIRRGDFVTNAASLSLLGILGPEYFPEGVKEVDRQLNEREGVKSQPRHIFVATEDAEWVKENVKFHHDYTIISRPGIYDFEELILMSTCDHFVISNSTFSWWSAWISNNPNKIIVAPKIWMRGKPDVETRDLVPTEWTRI